VIIYFVSPQRFAVGIFAVVFLSARFYLASAAAVFSRFLFEME